MKKPTCAFLVATRVAMLVPERGIDFESTDDYLQEARLAGGEDELISSLKSAKVTKVRSADSSDSIEKAIGYAQRALTAGPGLKKPKGADDMAFKNGRDNQLGLAHLTLGYAALIRAEKTTPLAPAIEDLDAASNLLEGNPGLQGQALFYLGFAYEKGYPANHRAAMEALNKAAALPGPFQGQAQALLAKVKAATQ